jgi:hypothetical protein
LCLVPDDDVLNAAGDPGGTEAHLVAGLDQATGDTPREAAEVEVWSINRGVVIIQKSYCGEEKAALWS